MKGTLLLALFLAGCVPDTRLDLSVPPIPFAQELQAAVTESLNHGRGEYDLGVVDFSGILGWNVLGHAGSALGYSAAALYLPDSGVVMAWAVNTGESPPELANTIMGIVWRSLSSVIFQNLGSRSP